MINKKNNLGSKVEDIVHNFVPIIYEEDEAKLTKQILTLIGEKNERLKKAIKTKMNFQKFSEFIDFSEEDGGYNYITEQEINEIFSSIDKGGG